MAILTLVKEINGNDFVIGYVCQFPSGEFWFNPKVQCRRPSTKRWDTAHKAIPRWAMNMADRIDDHRAAQ